MNAAMSPMMMGAGFGMSLFSGAKAQAPNRYAAVDIRNATNETIDYQFRWGPDAEWQDYSVAPHSVVTHFWTYEYADQNKSPKRQIRFYYNPGEAIADYKTYSLAASAVHRRVVGWGKRYVFCSDAHGAYLELYKE